MILLHNLDSFTSAETFNSRQVFVTVTFTVWGRRYLIFGSGTKLFVDEQVVKPVVSVYPAASRVQLEGKSYLLCLASDMFPPLVQFFWKRQKYNGSLDVVKPSEGEQLELREPGRTTSILLLHQPENSTCKYHCYVKHEGGTVEAQTLQEVYGRPYVPSLQQEKLLCPEVYVPPPPAPPTTSPTAPVPSLQQVKLLCLLSTVLIVKSLVYCCGLSLLMIL